MSTSTSSTGGSSTGASSPQGTTSEGAPAVSTTSVSSSAAAGAGFNSKLSAPRERFLAAVVEHALLVGRRSAKDFVRAFSPRDIMNALAEQPRIRAKLLVATTGLNEKIALKKSAISAGDDLELALNERVTEEDDVVALFDPDDRVRYLDHGRLWAFVVEGEFWRIGADAPPAIAREHVAFILDRARSEKLISDRDIIDGIGLPTLIESLPKEALGKVIEKALHEGRAGRVFKDERALDVLAPLVLVEHISLAHIWLKVIAAKLAFWKTPGGSATASASSSLAPSPTAYSSLAPSAASSTMTTVTSTSPAPPPDDATKLDAKDAKDAKDDKKPESKPDLKEDTKTDTKTDAKADAKADAKSDHASPAASSSSSGGASTKPSDRVIPVALSSVDAVASSGKAMPGLPSTRSLADSGDLPTEDDVDDLLSKVGVEAAAAAAKHGKS